MGLLGYFLNPVALRLRFREGMNLFRTLVVGEDSPVGSYVQ